MQAPTPSTAREPGMSIFDEMSALLTTRLAFHQVQLQHHQARIDEIEDMKQYLDTKFGPKPADQPVPVDTDPAQGQHTPVETDMAEPEAAPVEASIESAMTGVHPDPAAPEPGENSQPTEGVADAGHQTFGYQSMY